MHNLLAPPSRAIALSFKHIIHYPSKGWQFSTVDSSSLTSLHYLITFASLCLYCIDKAFTIWVNKVLRFNMLGEMNFRRLPLENGFKLFRQLFIEVCTHRCVLNRKKNWIQLITVVLCSYRRTVNICKCVLLVPAATSVCSNGLCSLIRHQKIELAWHYWLYYVVRGSLCWFSTILRLSRTGFKGIAFF